MNTKIKEFLKPDWKRLIIILVLILVSLSFIGTNLCKYCSVPCPESRPGFWLLNWDIQTTITKNIVETEPSTGPKFLLKTLLGTEPYDQYMLSGQNFPVENDLYFIPPFWIILLNIPYCYILSCLITSLISCSYNKFKVKKQGSTRNFG